ncbi:MAG: TIGR03936 family radical SAM-associated protein [Dehalococcoidia bacterium]
MKVQRLRVTFARGDLLRYITHLDLMRSWERAIKRAALPIAYSEGFTRHPQLALAAPLPVGATAEGELMDVFLESAIDPHQFHDRLSLQTPPGLSIERVDEVPLNLPSLQSLVKEWTWRAQFPPDVDPEVVREQVDQFLERDSFPWEQRREKEVKRFDLRALVLDIDVESRPEGPAFVARFKAEAGGRPEQLAAAMGYDPHLIRMHRLSLGLGVPSQAAIG